MISAVVLTKNEEKNIVDCLETLKWCDEIVVIDDNSQDCTVEIAKKMGAVVFVRSLDGDFARQRNYGLEKATHDWVLFVDCDERVSIALANELIQVLRNPNSKCNGYFVHRSDIMWGKRLKHGEAGNAMLLRLAKKDKGEWIGRVHEKWVVRGTTGELKNPILHYPHQTIDEFLREINLYTDIRSKELYDKGIKVYLWSIILYPKAKFFVNYFFKRGFLDGVPGFITAMMMSLHSFLVRGKLWLLWQKK